MQTQKPESKPNDPRFSSGPCKKHPGWSGQNLVNAAAPLLGRSHRAKIPKQRLTDAIERSKSLLGLPADWLVGIVPGSDTGAFEIAMWNLLGKRPIDALVWESFSSDWAADLAQLGLENLTVYEAPYGELPDLTATRPDHDIVCVLNGTTSGVMLPDMDFVAQEREGLVLCDATSAAFAMPIDFTRVDVLTWSWQKVLGGEAAHGMLALSPNAIARLNQESPPRPLPKLFRLTKNGKLIDGIFSGATINTPSMLAVEDLHSALDWAENIGGLTALHQRTSRNFSVVDQWVQQNDWIEWLASNPATRSPTSMCLQITSKPFQALSEDQQQQAIKTMLGWLEEESVALDIANYRSAPSGFRIWGGATIESTDLELLCPWLEWAYRRWQKEKFA